MVTRFHGWERVDWSGLGRGIRWTGVTAFCSMMLAFTLSVYWAKTQVPVLLPLAQVLAALSVLLRLREAILEAGLVLKAWRYVKAVWRDVRREDIRELRRRVRGSFFYACWSWWVVLALSALPFLMSLPAVVPGGEEVFLAAVVLFVVHFASADITYRRLIGAVVDSLDTRPLYALRC